MGQWWERQWGLRLHGIMLPFGVFIVTALMTRWISGQWPGQDNLKLSAELVDLATVIYGMIALTVEGGVRLMFWALQKHLEWRESMREEGRKEARKEMSSAVKQRDKVLARVAEEKGLTLKELLEQEGVK